MNKRIRREILTVEKMIRLYCKHDHKIGVDGCKECGDLLEYARKHTLNCKFGDQKPVCSNCLVHCYKPEKREKIKMVMRFSGPRMIWTYPNLAIQYIYDKKKYKA